MLSSGNQDKENDLDHIIVKVNLLYCYIIIIAVVVSPIHTFSVFTLLLGRREEHLAFKD